MAGWSGAGSFILPYLFVTDAANGIKILASRQDTQWATVATGLMNCWTLDGQTIPTANQNLNGKLLNNLGPGLVSTDAANLGQVAPIATKENFVYNPTFSVSQRGATFTPVAAGAYTVDRWNGRRAAGLAAGFTVAPVVDTACPWQTAVKLGRTVGDVVSLDEVQIAQPFETIDARKLIGNHTNQTGTVTILSCWMRAGTTLSTATYTLRFRTSTTTDASPYSGTLATQGTATAAIGTLSTTLYTRIFVVMTLAFPANSVSANITIGLNNSAATAGADDYLYVSGVKIDQYVGTASSTPTPFEPVLYPTDLARCERYYQTIGFAANSVIFSGFATNAGAGLWDHTLTLPVTMRAAPTATKAGTWALTNIAAQPTVPATSNNSIIIRALPTAATYTSILFDTADDGVTLESEL